jgi:two-component system, chemotaxis family, sensor kinase CheA
MEEAGFNVLEGEDGVVAWNVLEERGDDITMVLTDIEMPNMDGFALTEKIKNDKRFRHLPVIALTTLAAEEDIARGKAVGVNEYQIKLDKERLMESVFRHTKLSVTA